MSLAKEFNELHGTKVSRKTLELLLERAEKEKHTVISKRIIKVLKAFDDNSFLIEIVNLVEPFGLNGVEMEMFDFDELNEPEEQKGLNGIAQQDIYDLITQKIITDFENDHKWESGINDNFDDTFLTAYNFKTKKPYRGINQLLLGDMFGINKLENPYYLTFNQAEELGGKIKEGAKSKDAIFYTIVYKYKDFKTNDRQKFIEYIRNTGEFADEEIPSVVFQSGYGILRIYNVFNGKDIDGIDFNLSTFKENVSKEAEKIDIADKIIDKYPSPAPAIKYGGKQPFYQPAKDYVQMPKKSSFDDVRTFYAVMFHELVHSTGAKHRLNREKGLRFGDNKYAFEELVAEIGACFLSATCGFLYYTNKNANAYIKGWRRAIVAELKKDNQGIFKASAMAQKAVDFMLTNITEKDFVVVEIANYELFEQQSKLPKAVQAVINKFEKDEAKYGSYKACEMLVKNLKKYGYTCDYGLDGVPYDLRVIKKNKGSEPKGFDLSKMLSDNLEMQAVSDINKLLENGENFNVFRFLYTQFYLNNGKELINGQTVEIHDTKAIEKHKVAVYNDYYLVYDFGDGYEFSISEKGVETINKINNRLKSLKNQKHNYSFFDGLKGEKKAKTTKSDVLIKTKPVSGNSNKNSLAYKLANKPQNVEYFKIDDKQLSDFLGKIERKKKESVFISITGGQGSMKTRFAFQFMNALAQNYKVGHASIEEHPESAVYFDKVKQYLNNKALNNIEAPEIRTIADIHRLAESNDVIVIDSYTKAQEIEKAFEVDKDLRKKYDGKLFLVIFQQTTDGKMRGGSKSQFDADIVMFTKKEPDYRNNYVYHDKNRYQDKPLDNLHFNIYSGKINQTTEAQPVVKSKLSFQVS